MSPQASQGPHLTDPLHPQLHTHTLLQHPSSTSLRHRAVPRASHCLYTRCHALRDATAETPRGTAARLALPHPHVHTALPVKCFPGTDAYCIWIHIPSTAHGTGTSGWAEGKRWLLSPLCRGIAFSTSAQFSWMSFLGRAMSYRCQLMLWGTFLVFP